MKRRIKGVIFDLDGTLMDTLELRVTAWKEAFEKFNINLSREELRPLIGLPGEFLASIYSDRSMEIEMEEEKNFKQLLGSVALFPDALPVIKKMNSNDIKTIIVTSSRRELVNMLNLPRLTVITIDDVTSGKPGTEPYTKALKEMVLPPENVLVIGDSENDMIPARKIGSVSALIRHGRKLTSEYADYYIDQLAEVPRLIEIISS